MNDSTYTFKDIKAWQYAHAFVLLVYRVCRNLPDYERFGLCSQFERAAVSIAANIAEGYRKISKADKLRFINISQGSLEECRCYIYLASDFGYISQKEAECMIDEIEETSKVLNGYIIAIKDRQKWDN